MRRRRRRRGRTFFVIIIYNAGFGGLALSPSKPVMEGEAALEEAKMLAVSWTGWPGISFSLGLLWRRMSGLFF